MISARLQAVLPRTKNKAKPSKVELGNEALPVDSGAGGNSGTLRDPYAYDADMIQEWGDSHEGNSSDEDILIAQKIKKLMPVAKHDKAIQRKNRHTSSSNRAH